jgi:polyphosphate glucokinase
MPANRSAKKSRVARILAIDIGGTGLKAAIVDTKGRFLTERLRVKTPKRPVPKNIIPALVELAAPLKGYDHISIGFPGYVRDGVVFTAANLGTRAWKGFKLAQAVEKALGKPTRLNNDADV